MTDTRQPSRHAKLQSAADNLISAISNVHDATASAIAAVTTVAVLDALNNAQGGRDGGGDGDVEGQTFDGETFRAAADDFRRLLRGAATREWGNDEAVRELFVGLEETTND